MVIGRIDDTASFVGQKVYQVLKVPKVDGYLDPSLAPLVRNNRMWNIHVNDGWMGRGIIEGRSFLLATKPSMSTLRRVRHLDDGTTVRDFTVFFRELKMLRDAGYVQRVLPDGRVIMVPGS